MKIKTWMVEQAELLALVMGAVYLQGQTGLDQRGWTLALASAAMVMVSQKVRSGADRQDEQNRLMGVTPARLHCAAVMKKWGASLQVLSTLVSSATAPTWGHWLVLGWVTLYPLRRKLYRLWKPAKPEFQLLSPDPRTWEG
jgi:hypothetical protein